MGKLLGSWSIDFFPDFWVEWCTEGLISTTVMEVLILERSWAGLDTTGCRVGLDSTTIGSEWGIPCSDVTGSG